MMILVDGEMGVFFDRKMMRLFRRKMVVFFSRRGSGGGEMMLHAGVVEVLLGVVEVQITIHRRWRKHKGGLRMKGTWASFGR